MRISFCRTDPMLIACRRAGAPYMLMTEVADDDTNPRLAADSGIAIVPTETFAACQTTFDMLFVPGGIGRRTKHSTLWASTASTVAPSPNFWATRGRLCANSASFDRRTCKVRLKPDTTTEAGDD